MTSRTRPKKRIVREGHRIFHWNNNSRAPLSFLPLPASKADTKDDQLYEKHILVIPWKLRETLASHIELLKEKTSLLFKDLSDIIDSSRRVTIQKGGRMVIPRDIVGEIKVGTRLRIQEHGNGVALISIPRDGLQKGDGHRSDTGEASDTYPVSYIRFRSIDAKNPPGKTARKIITDEFLEDIRKREIQEPLLVVGHHPPYQLISGFKRYEAQERVLEDGKNPYIKAIIIPECSGLVMERLRAAMDFHPPVAHERLNTIDRINMAMDYFRQGIKVPGIVKRMGLKQRTVRDYLEIAQADQQILRALAADEIKPYQALELKRARMVPENFPKGEVPSVREIRRARAIAGSKELSS